MRKDQTMSRIKSIFAVILLTAIAGLVPQVQGQTLKVVIAGSSAMWQTLALGAYNNGTSIVSGGGATSHYTSTGNFNLTDTRSTVPTVDSGATWIVWDSASPANVWAYIKVDSVVGVRCYFAAPHCNVNVAAFPAPGNQISGTLWGADTAPPANIQALFTGGTLVTVGATDIRPEDALFATCRVNSTRGAGSGTGSDALDGLGYNTNNNAGVCPTFNAGTAQAKGVGNAILSGVPGSSSKANVLAFNLSGTDPITGTALPAKFTVTAVGAAPIIFVHGRSNSLTGLNNANETQLQAVFSGSNCDAGAFGLASGGINVFLREPLSGTMNTTEATVFRRPTVYPNGVLGISQEKGVDADLHGFKLDNTTPCVAGSGSRFRAIGTGQEVGSVSNSNVAGKFPVQQDGIGYTFFSYGNVSSISNNAGFGYITLNGVDPLFASFGTTIDPGQPTSAGVLPAEANLPATCLPVASQFPCDESLIWKNGFSFPNLRNGTYRSWSLLRLVATGVPSTNAAALATASNKFVVTSIPDYVPAAAVTGLTTKELGLKLLRSHYQQKDGNGGNIGAGPAVNNPEKGGDMGGAIIPTLIGVTTASKTQLVQSSNSDSSSLGPQIRP
jgi:hypothetical protein